MLRRLHAACKLSGWPGPGGHGTAGREGRRCGGWRWWPVRQLSWVDQVSVPACAVSEESLAIMISECINDLHQSMESHVESGREDTVQPQDWRESTLKSKSFN